MKYLILSISILASLSANAALYDRGNGMIYDSDQNITWLQDFGYATASNPDVGTYLAQFSSAQQWADNLTFGGYSDWRLPHANLVGDYSVHAGESEFDRANRIYTLYNQQSYDGSTDRGFNNARSELGHLFLELGNHAVFDTSGNPQSGGLTNMGLFSNMQAARYYEGDTFLHYSGELYVWVFDLSSGYQTGASQYLEYPTAPLWVAVRDGDVAQTPVPGAVWLFGSGLLGLIGVARKRR